MISFLLALSLLLKWTNPDARADTLRGYRSFDGTRESMQPALLWTDSLRTIPKRYLGLPVRDSAWVYLDASWQAPLRYHILRGAKVAPGVVEWSGPSNDVIASVPERGAVDTTYYLARRDNFATCFTLPRNPVRGVVTWALPYGDAERTDIVTIEYVNGIECANVLRLFPQMGHAWLRGVAWACP